MDILTKANILANAGQYDSCGPKACKISINKGLGGIYNAKAENKNCKIFKTLMNNDCAYDCKYCQNSAGCKKTKVKYEPKEIATIFDYLNKKLQVTGLFLSSGVSKNANESTEEMLTAVRMIRKSFKGYIHFKVLPGTSYELVKQASELSDRMSINIEAPNKEALSHLSTSKDYKVDILRRQAWIRKLKNNQSTQLMLHSTSTDKDVLKMVDWQYSEMQLKRVYYSSFQPVKGTKMQNEKAEPIRRQNRLYNVDFLVKSYNYKFKEFKKIMVDDMLPSTDPKMEMAKLEFDSPVDINEASYEELIRVPGIGPVAARKITNSKQKITRYEQLHNFGTHINRAKPFINVDGKRQASLLQF